MRGGIVSVPEPLKPYTLPDVLTVHFIRLRLGPLARA
jgi:hypothetical protein